MEEKFKFSTGTATIVIFDVKALKHRLDDAADWWSVPSFELAEVNLGNVLIIALGEDGVYFADVTDGIFEVNNSIVGMLNCPTGKIFIGAGEDISGAGYDPENTRHLSGQIVEMAPGTYELMVSRKNNEIRICFKASQMLGKNSFKQPLELLA
jgi:hypothetical protein